MKFPRLWITTLILINLLLDGNADYNKMTAGPYDIVFQYMEECPDIGTGDMLQYARIKKLNRITLAVDANVTLKVPFDDNITSTLKLSQFTNGGYKENFYIQEVRKTCSTLFKLLPVLVKEIMKAAKMGKGCPVKPGNYIIYNYISKEQIKAVPIFFYNKYKAEIVYTRFGRRIGCIQMFAEIIPKKHITHRKRN